VKENPEMRFQILKPAKAFDPRSTTFRSLDELRELAKLHVECKDERAAVDFVRREYPGAVALIFPVAIGSGDTVLLGFVNDDEQRRALDPSGEVNFVMLVQPIAEHEAERQLIKRMGGKVFSRELWKVRVERPGIFKRQSVELRAGDLEVPAFTDALIGHGSDGRLVIFVEVGGIEMSLHFDNKNVKITESDPASPEPYDGMGHLFVV
jgi:hypothetical protein